MGELRVVVDGVPLPDGEARAFWARFSTWMEEHVGDLAGFAAAEGLRSVRPEVHGGSPVLVASRSATQVPYATAVKRPDHAPAGGRPGGKGEPGVAGGRARPGGKAPEAQRSGSKRGGAKGAPPRGRGR